MWSPMGWRAPAEQRVGRKERGREGWAPPVAVPVIAVLGNTRTRATPGLHDRRGVLALPLGVATGMRPSLRSTAPPMGRSWYPGNPRCRRPTPPPA